jgi:hypothetical protein
MPTWCKWVLGALGIYMLINLLIALGYTVFVAFASIVEIFSRKKATA